VSKTIRTFPPAFDERPGAAPAEAPLRKSAPPPERRRVPSPPPPVAAKPPSRASHDRRRSAQLPPAVPPEAREGRSSPPPGEGRARRTARSAPAGDGRPRARHDAARSPKPPVEGAPPRRSPPSGRTDASFLEQAIDQRQIQVVFQPVVDLWAGSIFAYEALARSQSPYFADPTALFAAALKADRCGELGSILRELAVAQCPGAPLFVNVHPSELNDRYLVRPDDPLYSHPNEVYLEVTESVPISHYEFCHTVLREIRSRGVFLVVDNLGAGYSNLMYIVDLYPEVVKLDRQLVAGLHERPRQQKLVKHIVELCNGLGARVVAEGVETLHAVRDQGVRYVQGFLLARPSNPPPKLALSRKELGR
jgi:EAL domain-containing protein (putative c-di-GMP-specific phosphodiesterase class I)